MTITEDVEDDPLKHSDNREITDC